MNDARKIVGVVCIVGAMVLGAFAGLTFVQSGRAGAPSTAGTRGDDRRLVSALDAGMQAMAPDEARAVAESSAHASDSFLGSNPVEMRTQDGAVARRADPNDMRHAVEQGSHVFSGKDGTVTVTTQGAGTRYSGAGIDPGGPYGGPNTMEGTKLTFHVTPLDPTILFFRWDFDNDGIWDFPNQTGSNSLGRWTTLTTITWGFLDNFYGNLAVQGWDGVSTYIQVNTGNNLGEPTSPYWYVYPANSGYKFTPKTTMLVTQLGAYQWFEYSGFSIRIWDFNTQALLASCTPTQVTFQWNWCALSPAITLTIGHDYMLAEHKDVDYYPYFMALNSVPEPEKIHIGDFFYEWTTPDAFPSTDGGTGVIMMIDFQYRESIVRPDAAQAAAHLEVHNVAPSVFGVISSPNPGLEGTPTQLLASFADPGLNDTWQYQWAFSDGTQSAWLPVSKYIGGAKVLFLHTFSDAIGTLTSSVAATCGLYCVKIGAIDFGPLGEDRVPKLAELTPYHVVIVGTNYFNSHSSGIGDLLANYMDAGGNVVMLQGAFDNSFGDEAGIAGRWQDDGYSPIERGGIDFNTANLGRIYVPGHPLLNGVSTVSGFLRADVFGVTAGATRVADWDDGTVLAATNRNPLVANTARAVALNLFPYEGISGGDYIRLIVNGIHWAAQQPDPVVKPMPILLDPFAKVFADDEPTTTPQDTIGVSVAVRDDDEGRIEVHSQALLYTQNFNAPADCSGFWPGPSTFPPDWAAMPDYGWQCGDDAAFFGSRGPDIWYYYNDPNYGTGEGTSDLTTPSFDFSPFTAVRLEWYDDWRADYFSGSSDGYMQASFDGGRTYPYTATEYHHNAPAVLKGPYVTETVALGGQASVIFRFRYVSSDDWWWFFDNFRVTGLVGDVIRGLGGADGSVSIANVPPTVVGGFSTALRDEAQGLTFKGFKISDPALIQPTEWFAYRFNFDDGSPSRWVYLGSLAPPKFTVLVVNTICLGPIDVTCADYNALRDTLLAQDDVSQVDGFNFINYPGLPTAPSLSMMLQYDIVIVATNWAYFSYAPFDLARRQVGDRLADYVDSGRGGVLTMMCIYCLSGGNDLFSIRGRYMDDQYGAFKRANYLFPGASGIDILDPDHDAFVNVGSEVGSMFIHDARMPLTVGGNRAAAGTDGVLLAQWADDGTSAVGVKTLNTGVRTSHFGGFAHPTGSDTGMLLRNLIGWAHGGLPSPTVPTFTHTWGDNGVYAVDIEAIDDDMGWVWKVDHPVAALPGETTVSHRSVSVAVNNVDPTIIRTEPDSTQAFIASMFCVRVTGQVGNTVTLNIVKNGVLMGTTSVMRLNGDPNPATEKCAMAKVDVRNPASYQALFDYDAPEGGSNPTWLIISPWREPVTPGHGTTTYKYNFAKPGKPVVVQPLPTLIADLFATGLGAPIDFAAEAYDPGTDDLAFFWSWGGDAGLPYGSDPASVYTIHVHHNDGTPMTNGVLGTSQFLGFTEPYFERDANVGQSPLGTAGMRVRDTAVHAFAGGQGVYYVFILVLDDDNSRGYPSSYLHDGGDIEYITIDLR